jgi:hypothetical protein
MNMGHWILDEKGEKPVPVDLMTWAQWFESRKRILKQENVGDVYISTVFLGLDHNFDENGAPILWETMVFPQDENGKRTYSEQDCARCSGNREQAEAMHKEMVEKYKLLSEP